MAKYHINNRGEPGVCNAQNGACPFGGASDHYDSPEAASAAFEKLMEEKGYVKLHRKAQLEAQATANWTPKLSEIIANHDTLLASVNPVSPELGQIFMRDYQNFTQGQKGASPEGVEANWRRLEQSYGAVSNLDVEINELNSEHPWTEGLEAESLAKAQATDKALQEVQQMLDLTLHNLTADLESIRGLDQSPDGEYYVSPSDSLGKQRFPREEIDLLHRDARSLRDDNSMFGRILERNREDIDLAASMAKRNQYPKSIARMSWDARRTLLDVKGHMGATMLTLVNDVLPELKEMENIPRFDHDREASWISQELQKL